MAPADECARKAPWCEAEDLFILGAARRFGTQWPAIAAHLPGRSPDAVRNRWHRLQKVYLADLENSEAQRLVVASEAAVRAIVIPEPADRGRAPWTAEEDRIILEGVQRHGCKWRLIVAGLPGRSDSSARNRWLRLQKDRQESSSATSDDDAPGESLQASERPVPLSSPTILAAAVPATTPWAPATVCSQFAVGPPIASELPAHISF